MPDLTSFTVGELRAGYAARAISPVDTVTELADRIQAAEPVVNALPTLCFDRACIEAQQSERAYRDGHARLLEGVPFAVKDLFDTAGVRTTYGSAMFADHVPTLDAEAVRRARDAGAILVAKANTHEWAWGITTANPHFGPTRNPWAPDRVPGGSSGGSAAALATFEVPLALGSDTGGSIRIPAAYCGVVGLKPTYGRVSGAGAMPLAPSLDHPGPMARTPADAALFLRVLAGQDVNDPATKNMPLGDLERAFAEPAAGLCIGVCEDLHLVRLSPEVARAFDNAVAVLAGAGAEIVEVRFAEADQISDAFAIIQRAEALHTHRVKGLFPERRSEYGTDVLGRFDLATQVGISDYLDALASRRRVRAGFERLFARVDLLLTPVSAGPPVMIGDESIEHLGEAIAFRDLVMPYTVPQDLAGLPACSVRAGFDVLGVPIGIQITGPPWSEARVLRAANVFFERTLNVQAKWPEVATAVTGGDRWERS